jgi:uncharacterized protein YkwD
MAAALIVSLPSAHPVAAAGATFVPETAGSELMRLLNAERRAHDMPALAVDPFLAWVARDGPVACPDGAATAAGRAKDMAVNNYFSHALRLCPASSAVDAMRSWGYSGSRGEIIAMNSGYTFDPAPYELGCDVAGAGCSGGVASAPQTVARAASGFMTSQGHRDIVLSGSYDRFACGAWQTANGSFYACMFAFGAGDRGGPGPAPDTTAPTMTDLAAPSLVTSAARTFTVTFAASDDVAVTGYELRTRRGSAGAWSAPMVQAARSRTFRGLAAGTWYIGVRALDVAGNPSEWRETAVVIPTDDRAWSFSAGTVRRTGGAYIRGTATSTATAGATMRISFSGSTFSLVGTAGPAYGRLRVTLDGHSYTVDTGSYRGARATGNHYRVVLFSRSLAAGRHVAVITCLATPGRRTISIDAAGWRT